MARLHEHLSKALLKEHGLTIPKGELAYSPADARRIAIKLDRPVVV